VNSDIPDVCTQYIMLCTGFASAENSDSLIFVRNLLVTKL